MSSVRQGTPGHIAWLIPLGTLSFMCGIFLGSQAETWWPGAVALALSMAAALLSRRWRRTAAIVLVTMSVGTMLGWRTYHPVLPPEGTCRVRGTVVQVVSVEDEGHVQTQLADVRLDDTSAPDAYWTFYLDEEELLPEWLEPGAQVSMQARVYHPSGQENPGGFNFKEYLLQRNIGIGIYGNDDLQPAERRFSLRGSLAALRHELSQGLMRAMGQEAGEYASAMLLGMKSLLADEDVAAFRKLGIAHILSVSGYHVGVLAGMMLLLLRPWPVGRKVRLTVETFVLGAYCMLCGGNAPVVRAVGLLLWREITRLRNRQILPLHMLCITAAVQLMFNPALLLGASFQMSYGAMLGLLLVYPWLKQRRVCKTQWGQRLWEAFGLTLSAQLGILLPQLYWFGELPLLSILFNMLLIPYAGVMMSLYWVALAVLPIPVVREVLGFLAAQATALLLWGVRWLSALETAALWTRQADTLTLAGWLLLLWSLSVLVPVKWERWRGILRVAGIALVALILIPVPEKGVTYTQFSVGNEDAAILQDGHMTVAIDVGEEGQTVANYLHQRRQSIDLLILTHLHTDHAGGVQALLEADIPVDVCCLPDRADVPAIDVEVLPLLEALAKRGTEFRVLSRGDMIDLPSGALNVLWPERGRVFTAHDANDVCLVLHADICGVTMLLASDLSGMYERHLAIPADILKAAHHGSAASTSPEFLQAVSPQMLLLSNSNESREARMAELAGEIPLYSTGRAGAVAVRFLGEGKYEVQPFLTE